MGRPPSVQFGMREPAPMSRPHSYHEDSLHGPPRNSPGAGLGRTVPGALHLVIHGCYNLLNKDTGLMGDYSDPYVVGKVGRHEKKTPVINNDLNPVWHEDNRFAFEVKEDDPSLELEVFNKNNIFNNDSLGKYTVDLRTMPLAEWKRYRVFLEEGGKNNKGELEFDVRLEPKRGEVVAPPQ